MKPMAKAQSQRTEFFVISNSGDWIFLSPIERKTNGNIYIWENETFWIPPNICFNFIFGCNYDLEVKKKQQNQILLFWKVVPNFRFKTIFLNFFVKWKINLNFTVSNSIHKHFLRGKKLCQKFLVSSCKDVLLRIPSWAGRRHEILKAWKRK